MEMLLKLDSNTEHGQPSAYLLDVAGYESMVERMKNNRQKQSGSDEKFTTGVSYKNNWGQMKIPKIP